MYVIDTHKLKHSFDKEVNVCALFLLEEQLKKEHWPKTIYWFVDQE